MPEKVLEIFSKIHQPNAMCLTLLFTSCARIATQKALAYGHEIFEQLPKSFPKDEFLMTSVLDMFVKCGDVFNAEKIFSQLDRTIFDYGQMMKCYNQKEMPMKTWHLYEQMKAQGLKADFITFLLIIDACSNLGLQSKCQLIVDDMSPELQDNVMCQTALIDMWVTSIRSILCR